MNENSIFQKKIKINFKRNKLQDNTEELDKLALGFNYEEAMDDFWNPEEYSLLYGSPVWDQATHSQRVILNQLYWLGYYSQIISAEIATIYLNQAAAAGLYQLEEFRTVCDNLDLESSQERAHINAFKTIVEKTEKYLYKGERIFSYPMKNFATETMIFQKTNPWKKRIKRAQLIGFSALSTQSPFIASQFFTVRGLRTLNGKLIQHELSKFYSDSPYKKDLPIPSQISYHHFLDESFHFNSSTIIGKDLLRECKRPNQFEALIGNLGVMGTQIDHRYYSQVVRGIFWYDPATFITLLKILIKPPFHMDLNEALHFLNLTFGKENEGIHLARNTHQLAKKSYQNYLSDIDYLWAKNRNVGFMKSDSIKEYLKRNIKELKKLKVKTDYGKLPDHCLQERPI